MAPILMTLNDNWPIFQGHRIMSRWISEMVRDTGIFSSNRNLHAPYRRMLFRM